jgi:hypothetical protein
LNPVASLPSASRAVTFTAGVIDAPAVLVAGGTVNTSAVAAPGVMLKEMLEAFGRPDAAADNA